MRYVNDIFVAGVRIIDGWKENRHGRLVTIYNVECAECAHEFQIKHDSIMTRQRRETIGCVKCRQKSKRQLQKKTVPASESPIYFIDQYWRASPSVTNTPYYGGQIG